MGRVWSRRLGALVSSLALVAGGAVASSVLPATAASGMALGTGQQLSQVKLVRQTAFRSSPANLAEGTVSSGAPAAFTDDPNLVRAMVGGGTAATSFPQNAATTASSGSEAPSGDARGGVASSVKGLNARDLAVTHGFVVEPPDQGLCAGNGYVIEMVNLNLKIFDAKLNALTGPMVLETFFGDNIAFGVYGGDVTVQGDPRCYWDAGTDRWFLSQLVLDLSNNTAMFQLAVSTTANPLGSYNLYSADTTDNANPGCPCFGDQPTMGANSDAIFITTNEFSINNPVFNGAVLYAIDKRALANGEASANMVTDFIGLTFPTPEWRTGVNCVTTGGLYCWASVRPSSSPTSGDRRFGGVEYLMSALDFANKHDNRIGVWALTNTSSIRTSNPQLGLTEATLASEPYTFPSFARQKAGPIPLGDSGRFTCVPAPCAEGGIQTNDDQIQNSVYAAGLIWGGLNTTVHGRSGQVGIAYFAVEPSLNRGQLSARIVTQGYLTAAGNDIAFPSVGVDSQGEGVLSFTLTGPGYYPTSAYAKIDRSGTGKVKVAALGQSPQDGFSEYQHSGTASYRPRWGDYSAAVPVGQAIYFASEYIQYTNCSDATFKTDPSCGGTRSRSANWGTSVNVVNMSDEDSQR
ncbi:MAG TPA: hypothetical protein VLU92_01690 [Candidatus Dormibacteraeota bacterium]|nr:hypothetical protein [Candidatus Dormibacteraeota bacterium]